MSWRNPLLCSVLLGSVLCSGTDEFGAFADASISPSPHLVSSGVAAEPSDPEALVDIPDAVLRGALEEALGKDRGEPITRGDMAGLYGLAIEEGVDELTGMEHAINLVWLVCENGSVSVLTPLAELEALEFLSLQFNAIWDLTPLGELGSLTSLSLNGNAISDVAPLGGLDALTHLDLYYNAISDITPLAGVDSLTSLNLGFNDISDIAPVAELTSLMWLDLRINTIFDIAPLAGLDALTGLYLNTNNVSNVAPIAELDSLTSLGLSYNAISDITPLVGLESVSTLDLDDNIISDISPLLANEGLGSGDTLALEGNPLSARALETDIPTLRERGVEVTFDTTEPEPLADGDRAADIPDAAMRTVFERFLNKGAGWPIGVEEIAEIVKIDARGSRIEDLAGLEHATGLRYLDLSGNAVMDLALLEGLSSLRLLYLDGNEIGHRTAGGAALADLVAQQHQGGRPLGARQHGRTLLAGFGRQLNKRPSIPSRLSPILVPHQQRHHGHRRFGGLAEPSGGSTERQLDSLACAAGRADGLGARFSERQWS